MNIMQGNKIRITNTFGKEPSPILIVVGCHQNSVRPWQSATLAQRLSVQCIWRGPVFAEWLKALWRRYNLRILLSFEEEEEGRTIWDGHSILIYRALQHVWVWIFFWYCSCWQGLWKKLCSMLITLIPCLLVLILITTKIFLRASFWAYLHCSGGLAAN